MREFKFRYWDTANGNWKKKFHYFDLEPRKDSLVVGCEIIVLPLDRPNRYIIQQYTGLKDDNGKEIYEGDIMKHHNTNRYGVVKMEMGQWLLHFKETNVFYDLYGSDNEVVGNIFEDPELLS
jgi:uncharacterized phage protein (TIGR01671 family)